MDRVQLEERLRHFTDKFSVRVESSEGANEPLTLIVERGTASDSELSELFEAMDDLYREMGGDGLRFNVTTIEAKE